MTTQETFRRYVESNKGCAVILAGSGSDKPHIEEIVASLTDYQIPHQVRIVSAHKQPEELMEIVREYDSWQGPLAYIAVAGGTDALSGMVSYHSSRPTISCPPDHPNMSCLTNPPGSSNMYIGNPANVGKAVAQLFAHLNPEYRLVLEKKRVGKIAKLQMEDLEHSQKSLEWLAAPVS